MNIKEAREHLKIFANYLSGEFTDRITQFDAEAISTVLSELDKKDKIINEMANNIADSSNMYENLVNAEFQHTAEEVIDYFTKKVDEENEQKRNKKTNDIQMMGGNVMRDEDEILRAIEGVLIPEFFEKYEERPRFIKMPIWASNKLREYAQEVLTNFNYKELDEKEDFTVFGLKVCGTITIHTIREMEVF